jgi:hypothetical protein
VSTALRVAALAPKANTTRSVPANTRSASLRQREHTRIARQTRKRFESHALDILNDQVLAKHADTTPCAVRQLGYQRRNTKEPKHRNRAQSKQKARKRAQLADRSHLAHCETLVRNRHSNSQARPSVRPLLVPTKQARLVAKSEKSETTQIYKTHRPRNQGIPPYPSLPLRQQQQQQRA